MSIRKAAVAFSLSLLVAIIGLAGCGGGGGGGGGGGNTAPVISSLVAAEEAIWQSQSTSVTANASDSDGDALTYGWAAGGGAVTGSGATVTYNAPATGGAYTLTATVTDGRGGQDAENVQITVGATVEGTVQDVTTGQVAPGIDVIIDGITDGTDAQGAFSITGVGQGQHAVTLGGNWVVAGADVSVTANTPGQTVQIPSPVTAVDVGGGPPPPPFS